MRLWHFWYFEFFNFISIFIDDFVWKKQKQQWVIAHCQCSLLNGVFFQGRNRNNVWKLHSLQINIVQTDLIIWLKQYRLINTASTFSVHISKTSLKASRYIPYTIQDYYTEISSYWYWYKYYSYISVKYQNMVSLLPSDLHLWFTCLFSPRLELIWNRER